MLALPSSESVRSISGHFLKPLHAWPNYFRVQHYVRTYVPNLYPWYKVKIWVRNLNAAGAQTHTHKHTLTLSLILFLSLSLIHTHTQIRTHTNTHTHTHIYIYIHTHTLTDTSTHKHILQSLDAYSACCK